MFDGKAFGGEIVEIVKGYVDKAVAPVAAENEALKRRLAELEAKAAQPIPDFPALIAGEVAKAVAAIPVARDGEPGRDGQDVDPESVAAMISSEVEKAVAAIPHPKDGEPGRDGADADPQAIADLVTAEVGRAVSALPKAVDGKDGLGLAGAMIDRDGDLVVTLTNGEIKKLGPVVGTNGTDGVDADMDALHRRVDDLVRSIPPAKDGEPGRDGFSLKDFDAEVMPDGRTLLLKFEDETDIRFAVELSIPTMIYRGVFKEGHPYEKGDTVTWGGSLWHCDADTAEKPGDGAKAWTLAAKRGRDGKDKVV